MLVLVYRKCSTCQKALSWLETNNITFTERPIVEENPTYEELKAWYAASELPLKKFFNTSGLLYKELGLKDKLPEMSEDEQLRLFRDQRNAGEASAGDRGWIRFDRISGERVGEEVTEVIGKVFICHGNSLDFTKTQQNQGFPRRPYA